MPGTEEEVSGWLICPTCAATFYTPKAAVCSNGHGPTECVNIPTLFKYLGNLSLMKKDPNTEEPRKRIERLLLTVQQAAQYSMAAEDKEEH